MLSEHPTTGTDEIWVIAESFEPATHRVILVDDEVAGILAAPVHEAHIQLEKLYLLPRFQRRGHRLGSSS